MLEIIEDSLEIGVHLLALKAFFFVFFFLFSFFNLP